MLHNMTPDDIHLQDSTLLLQASFHQTLIL